MLPLWDTTPHRRRPVITTLLIAVNLAVFAWEIVLISDGGRTFENFIQAHALTPRTFANAWMTLNGWLPVFYSMFLHGSVAHVAGNCWFLWVFGNNVEDRLGPVKYLLLYLLAGVCAALSQFAAHPDSTIPMIGASGAISGVLGAYFLLLPTSWIVALVPWIVPVVPLPAFVFLFSWFAMQALQGVGSLLSGQMEKGGVAWWAHAGGFAAGAVMVLFARKAGWVKRRR